MQWLRQGGSFSHSCLPFRLASSPALCNEWSGRSGALHVVSVPSLKPRPPLQGQSWTPPSFWGSERKWEEAGPHPSGLEQKWDTYSVSFLGWERRHMALPSGKGGWAVCCSLGAQLQFSQQRWGGWAVCPSLRCLACNSSPRAGGEAGLCWMAGGLHHAGCLLKSAPPDVCLDLRR